MEPCRLHVFFCRQQKPGGLVCCGARGAPESLAALQKEIIAQGLDDEVQVTPCDSIGVCGRGPNMVVYPEGLWYTGVTPEAAVEIVREHFKNGRPVERLIDRDMGKVKTEFLHHRARMREVTQALGAVKAGPPAPESQKLK
jgi:(2Fe-2S) ferredoxin